MTLRLRKVTPEDSERLLAWRNSPDVSAHMLTDHLISPAEHEAWFAAMPKRPDRKYWIIEAGGEPVGLTNLSGIDLEHRRCEWAYYLADPGERGRGLGSGVQYIVLRHVFETMQFEAMSCQVLAGNSASLQLLEGVGFVRDPRASHQVIKGGRPQEVIALGLSRGAWPAARAALEARLRGYGIAAVSLPAAP